jgi:uncharacterized protein (TIGR00369 family)
MAQRYAVESLFGTDSQEFVAHVPHCAAIGMRCTGVGPAKAGMMVPHRDDLVGDPGRGVVFGGVVTTLLDQAGGAATLCSLEAIAPIATIDLRIDYLRPAAPGRDLYGEAECFKRTRSVAFVRGKAWDEDERDPFAHFIATYMLGSSTGEHPLERAAREAAAPGGEAEGSPSDERGDER